RLNYQWYRAPGRRANLQLRPIPGALRWPQRRLILATFHHPRLKRVLMCGIWAGDQQEGPQRAIHDGKLQPCHRACYGIPPPLTLAAAPTPPPPSHPRPSHRPQPPATRKSTARRAGAISSSGSSMSKVAGRFVVRTGGNSPRSGGGGHTSPRSSTISAAMPFLLLRRGARRGRRGFGNILVLFRRGRLFDHHAGMLLVHMLGEQFQRGRPMAADIIRHPHIGQDTDTALGVTDMIYTIGRGWCVRHAVLQKKWPDQEGENLPDPACCCYPQRKVGATLVPPAELLCYERSIGHTPMHTEIFKGFVRRDSIIFQIEPWVGSTHHSVR